MDDEEVIRHLAKDVLESLGYQVMLAANGQEAIRLYEENSDSIALILLDMIMPQMGGDQTYTRLREINPNVKIVLSSGYTRDGIASRLLVFIKKICPQFFIKLVVKRVLGFGRFYKNILLPRIFDLFRDEDVILQGDVALGLFRIRTEAKLLNLFNSQAAYSDNVKIKNSVLGNRMMAHFENNVLVGSPRFFYLSSGNSSQFVYRTRIS